MNNMTDAYVDKLPFRDPQQTLPSGHPGLFLVVGSKTKTWSVRASGPDPKTGKTRQHKKALGKFPDVNCRRARELADELKIAIRGGEVQKTERTLTDAWETLRTKLMAQGRSDKTIEGYEYGMTLLEPFHDASLRFLAEHRGVVHDEALLALERGQGAQNAFIQTLRSIYRNELKRDVTLPPIPPTFGLEVKTMVRNRAIGGEDIEAWANALDTIPSGVKREFWWFMLLSGARTGALRRAKWSDLDRQRRVLTIPEDKNGGYDLPLSREMIRCLVRAARVGQLLNPQAAKTYVFPRDPDCRSEVDHMGHPKYCRKVLPYQNHDLRHGWSGFADDAGLAQADKDALGNWKPKTQGGRYTNVSKRRADKLREAQERVTAEILSHLPDGHPRKPRGMGAFQSAEVIPFTNEGDIVKVA